MDSKENLDKLDKIKKGSDSDMTSSSEEGRTAVVDLEIIRLREEFLENTGINLLPADYEAKKAEAVEIIIQEKIPVQERESILARSERLQDAEAQLLRRRTALADGYDG